MFIEPNFIFRGKDCKEFNVQIVGVNEDVLNYKGKPYSRTINKESIANNIAYTQEPNDTEEFTLNLALLDKNDLPMTWTTEIYNRICDWLISDSFEQFISYDDLTLVHYVMVTEIKPKLNYRQLGWIEVTFKPLDNFRYKILERDELVFGSKVIEIFNESKNTLEPLITLENLGTKNNIIYINDFMISGLEENEVVYIDNYMTNVMNDEDENRLYLCNRQWIKLQPGINQILVKGDCNVNIYCEIPMK